MIFNFHMCDKYFCPHVLYSIFKILVHLVVSNKKFSIYLNSQHLYIAVQAVGISAKADLLHVVVWLKWELIAKVSLLCESEQMPYRRK